MLDLGSQPLANSFLAPADLAAPEPRYPLELCRCTSCGHMQLSLTVPPEIMFRNYLYVSGTSETIPAHFAAYAREIAERFVPAGGLVVEIGSNDGTLLRAFDRSKLRVLGVEPARNIAKVANAAGIPTVDEFFDEATAKRLATEHGRAAAMIGNNVVAHIDDLHGLLRGAQALLAPSGVFVVEFPYLVDLLERRAYDTIYHEHLSYFSVASVVRLTADYGMRVVDVRRVSVHGGSIRLFISGSGTPSISVGELLTLEASMRLADGEPLTAFVADVRRQRVDLRALLTETRKRGRIAGYGAPAKGNTLLNYCGIDTSLVDFVVDRSPLKHGLLTPGTHIPVEPPDRLLASGVKETLLLAWNFAEEILRQQEDYRSSGGRFIIPIPTPLVV
ncbi:MAG: class I SAM-dependent methyltransferase [Chloroflexota bacterium]|nr:class I SAM-dependent methyltransferase [Chloroflexota bacterium]